MSSPGNHPTLTLKLERDSSPFTPRSPKNFPLQVDISSEDEYEKFLADLCNAEEELGLALPPGLATSQGSGQVKARKTRSKGRKIEGHRASWSEDASIRLPDPQGPAPNRRLERGKILDGKSHRSSARGRPCVGELLHGDARRNGKASKAGKLTNQHTRWRMDRKSPCQAPIPLASAVPAATARQVFRVADLDLCGGKRGCRDARSIRPQRADPQLSKRPERGLRTGGGACSGTGVDEEVPTKSVEAERRRRRAANDHNAGAASGRRRAGAQKAGAAATTDEDEQAAKSGRAQCARRTMTSVDDDERERRREGRKNEPGARWVQPCTQASETRHASGRRRAGAQKAGAAATTDEDEQAAKSGRAQCARRTMTSVDDDERERRREGRKNEPGARWRADEIATPSAAGGGKRRRQERDRAPSTGAHKRRGRAGKNEIEHRRAQTQRTSRTIRRRGDAAAVTTGGERRESYEERRSNLNLFRRTLLPEPRAEFAPKKRYEVQIHLKKDREFVLVAIVKKNVRTRTKTQRWRMDGSRRD
ncbi:hypothetical protein C8R47DRAFT_1062861 [Mycena vitilis]|nr:hypothetical protein C8R47DRAFT_1062861 [Mycena vitilis]